MALPAQNPASIGTGKDYSTVLAWEADLDDANLDANYTGEVYGLTEDNSTVYFDGGNSTASYKAVLRAASGEEADGTNAKGAQIDVVVIISETTNQWNMDIETIEFHTVGRLSYTADHADNVTNILKCVFRDIANHGISILNCGAAEINIGVCLFRNLSTIYDTGINLTDADPSVKVINCTAYDMDYGCMNENTGTFALVKNCVSVCDEVDAGYDDYRGTPSNMSYCADSGDNTATGTGSIHTAARADEWVDYTADNFKVKNTSAHIYHAGVQITGESWFPATDMAGVAWNDPPSMGCFEYVAVGGYTITANTGSYGMTGQATGLLANRKLPTEAGSYNLTGTIAELLRGYPLTAEAGAYTITGQDVGLKKDSKVSIDSGVYNIAGQEVDILKDSLIPIGSGSYDITGQDADLLRDLLISIESGTYGLTGSDVTLIYTPVGTYTLIAGSGTYSLTGSALDLLRGYHLGIEAGIYALLGEDVLLLKDSQLSAQPGSYNISGQAAALLRGYLISAEQGNYDISGQDIAFLRGFVIGLEAGGYDLSGQDVELTHGKITIGCMTITFDSKQPSITFDSKQPSITFEDWCD